MPIGPPPFALVLDGDLTISRSEQIQNLMLDALQTHQAVEIDCSGAREMDVTFLQILISAGRTALAWNKSLCLSAPLTGLLADTLSRCGFPSPASDANSVSDIFSCHSPAHP